MSHPILVTGASGGSRDQPGGSSRSPAQAEAFRRAFVINSMRGRRNSAGKVRKSSRAISSTSSV